MTQVIDFKTKSQIASAQDKDREEEFASFVEKILSKENTEGMKSGIVILWGEESTEPSIWTYNAGDKDVLWFSEMLREMALYEDDEDSEWIEDA